MSTSNYKPGTRVRVTLEGVVQAEWISGYSIQGDGSSGYSDRIHYVNGGAKIEVVCPDVKPGDVWEAGDELFFARQPPHMGLILLPAGGYRNNRKPDEFFANFPDATRVFEGRA